MAALGAGCPASVSWLSRRLKPSLRYARCLYVVAAASNAKAPLVTWTQARPPRSGAPPVMPVLPAAPKVTGSLSCFECARYRRRYLATSRNLLNDSERSFVFATPPPPSTSSSNLSPPTAKQEIPDRKDETLPLPPTETAKTEPASKNDQAPKPVSSPRQTQNLPSLPSFVESRRSALHARFSRFMDDLQARFVSASQALSDLTGYTAIEHIKAHNAQLENDLATAQAELRVARRTYQAVNERRAATQREVTTLLARKDSWAPPDLERFTVLYRQDHELETSAQRSVEQLKEAEADEQRLSAALTSGILKRYHEEQVWSDRIRRQSTWGTWGLMGINVVLFIILQVVAEPWRRRRLLRGIAEAESDVLEDVRKELADVRAVLATVATAEDATADTAQPPETALLSDADLPTELASVEQPPVDATAVEHTLPAPPLRLQLFSLRWPTSFSDVFALGPNPVHWKAWFEDISSERTVNVRMRDVSIVALKSAIAGAALVGGLVFVFR
ncbi:sensitivity to high expression protein she9 [Sporothrix epigloea]|uniref:Sensitive to high expression protein 9, mitochondrial n=1 Tax=Sporothrix epigloea TaxID=1892477 RepID=A0ABP0DU22_9PEZI